MKNIVLLRVALNKVNGAVPQMLKYHLVLSYYVYCFILSSYDHGQKLLPTASIHTLTSKRSSFPGGIEQWRAGGIGFGVGAVLSPPGENEKPSQRGGGNPHKPPSGSAPG